MPLNFNFHRFPGSIKLPGLQLVELRPLSAPVHLLSSFSFKALPSFVKEFQFFSLTQSEWSSSDHSKNPHYKVVYHLLKDFRHFKGASRPL